MLSVSMLFGVLLAVQWSNAQIRTRFSCVNRPSGYYADLETGCQVYHMCDGLGRQFSYSCPNATLFQQRMLVCDHWYMVNCSKSEVDYQANLLIGQKDKPFVEDSVKHPYYRTPRPDLLNHDVPEYNSIYRNGRSQFGTNLNVVGVETDNENQGTTDQPSYSLPSHWFTEYTKEVTTKRNEDDKSYNLKQYKVTKSSLDYSGSVNKKPITVDNKEKVKPVVIGGQSFNKFATKEEEPVPVNFRSNYKNTTPVYPLTVPEEAKEDTMASTETAPEEEDGFERVPFGPPSRYYEPPDYEPIHAPLIASPSIIKKNINTQTIANSEKLSEDSEKKWKDLRQLFLIPDYEFPLESVSRPSYENGQSSFQVGGLLPPEVSPK